MTRRPVSVLAVINNTAVLGAVERALASSLLYEVRCFTARTAAEGLELLDQFCVDFLLMETDAARCADRGVLRAIERLHDDALDGVGCRALVLLGESPGADSEHPVVAGALTTLAAVPQGEQHWSHLLSHLHELLEAHERGKLQEREHERRARHDDLTGLYHRRALMHQLEFEAERSRRFRRPFCLLAAEIDDFSALAERHGREFGDRVLRVAADAILASIRTTDYAGRIGPHEFCVVLTESDLAAARVVGERIRRTLEAASVDAGAGLAPSLSVSIGATQFLFPDDDLEPLLRRADKELARARAAGRNRVSLAAPGVSDAAPNPA